MDEEHASRGGAFWQPFSRGKAAQQALQESEARYRTLVEHAPIAVVVHSDARIVFANAHAVAALNATGPDDLIGRSIWDFVDRSYRQVVAERIEAVYTEAGTAPLAEEKFIGLDGQAIDVEVMGTPIVFEGRPAVQVFFQDISQRKRAEAALQASETRYRLLMQESPFGIQVFDPDGTLVQVNKAWEAMWGVHAEQVLGRYNALHDPQLEALGMKDFVDRAFAGETVTFADVMYTPDASALPGRPRWVRAHCYHIRNPHGVLQHVVLLSEDITERKWAEEQVRESETRYRTLVEEINDVIFMLDAEGHFTYISPAIRRISSYTPEEILGKPFTEFVHPDDVEHLVASYQRTLGGTLAPSEFRTLNKEGTVQYLRSFSRPIYEQGQPVGLRGVMVDITGRKQSEQERERLIADLEAKNAELERFTYTVSHDLKSPLVTIKGFLGLLEQDALEGNTEQMQQDLRQIHHAADQMQRLLGDLLELSRIGRLINPSEPIALGDLIREAVDLVAGQIRTRGVEVVVAEGMPVVWGDRARLLEVYQNLVDNAVKFMGDQPQPRIAIDVYHNGEELVCTVRDNGIGIPPAYHNKVFGLFERLHPEIEGTGIGLALVKRTVEVHGGRIEVVSDGAGHGTAFHFTLPPTLPDADGEVAQNF